MSWNSQKDSSDDDKDNNDSSDDDKDVEDDAKEDDDKKLIESIKNLNAKYGSK